MITIEYNIGSLRSKRTGKVKLFHYIKVGKEKSFFVVLIML